MKASPAHLLRIHTVLTAQFQGIQLVQVLGEVNIEISKKTKRIKYIYDSSNNEKQLLFSLRTSDGRFLPTMEAARRILASGYNENRIFVNDEAAPFVAKGKTTFCKHVLKVDDNIVPNRQLSHDIMTKSINCVIMLF
ncbi:MAG: hypothetical protein ACXAD7_06815 [Candidatus Kariarchaeaceae archaeon]|jgi:uncharacterized protein with predicted RNA binding PUA domain